MSRVKSHISSIAVTADDSFIYAADDDGYVYVYSIKDYALQDPEREPPKYVNHWRAHVNIVVSVEVVDEEKVLLSSSIDCTVRLWSLDGEYIVQIRLCTCDCVCGHYPWTPCVSRASKFEKSIRQFHAVEFETVAT
ncbi:WD repeat-containing protein 64-like [Chrysemys picta bellii]|uniref:WD repeat-containing protein 64-like n=1 Tax=Chrysemys picta bellii TaxID=8478 RepID=UPI0032B27230